MDKSNSILRGNPACIVLGVRTRAPYRGLLEEDIALGGGVGRGRASEPMVVVLQSDAWPMPVGEGWVGFPTPVGPSCNPLPEI